MRKEHEDFLRSAKFNANVDRNDEVFVEMRIKFYIAICHDVVIILRFMCASECVFVRSVHLYGISVFWTNYIYNTCIVSLFMAASSHILTLIFVHFNHSKYYDLIYTRIYKCTASFAVNLSVSSLFRRRMFIRRNIKTK